MSQQVSVLAKEVRFEGFGAPKSQPLIFLSLPADTIFVPSGENATELMPPLWAFVFSAAQLMSIANILRTREKYKRLRLYVRAFGSIWRYGTTSGCKLEGRLTCLGADMQQPTACRKDEGTRVRRVWLRSSSQTESQ